MRTTVTLDQDVYETAMHLSRVSGARLGKVLSDLARRGLHPPVTFSRKKGQRFPTFDVPPGTPMMSMAAIQKFLDEEGIF